MIAKLNLKFLPTNILFQISKGFPTVHDHNSYIIDGVLHNPNSHMQRWGKSKYFTITCHVVNCGIKVVLYSNIHSHEKCPLSLEINKSMNTMQLTTLKSVLVSHTTVIHNSILYKTLIIGLPFLPLKRKQKFWMLVIILCQADPAMLYWNTHPNFMDISSCICQVISL